MFYEILIFNILLLAVPEKINDPWRTQTGMLGAMYYVFSGGFADHSRKTKRLISWLSIAPTNFEKCHHQDHHFSLADILYALI